MSVAEYFCASARKTSTVLSVDASSTMIISLLGYVCAAIDAMQLRIRVSSL